MTTPVNFGYPDFISIETPRCGKGCKAIRVNGHEYPIPGLRRVTFDVEPDGLMTVVKLEDSPQRPEPEIVEVPFEDESSVQRP